MAKVSNSKPAAKGKGSSAGRNAGKSPSSREPKKLDDVSDAPESGEPREEGRSRGRVIDEGESRPGTGRARAPGKPAGRSAGVKASGRRAKDPRAAAERDESGNTANEAWESGRQKAMEE